MATGTTRPSKASVGCQCNIPSGGKVLLKPTKAGELFFNKSKYTRIKSNYCKQKSAKLQLNKYKRATSNKSTYILPPPLPLLVKDLASHINMSNLLTHLHLSQEECNAVENATHTQSLNPVWYEQRKGRLTASKFYRIYTRADTKLKKKDENVNKLVNDIMGKKDYIQTFAMKHEIAMETHAKRKVTKIFKETHKQVSSDEVDLFNLNTHTFGLHLI